MAERRFLDQRLNKIKIFTNYSLYWIICHPVWVWPLHIILSFSNSVVSDRIWMFMFNIHSVSLTGRELLISDGYFPMKGFSPDMKCSRWTGLVCLAKNCNHNLHLQEADVNPSLDSFRYPYLFLNWQMSLPLTHPIKSLVLQKAAFNLSEKVRLQPHVFRGRTKEQAAGMPKKTAEWLHFNAKGGV